MEAKAEAVVDGGSGVEGKKEEVEGGSNPSSPRHQVNKEPRSCSNEEDELESIRAEISEMKQENERLNTALSQVIMDYKSLQMQFSSIVPKEQDRNNSNNSNNNNSITPMTKEEGREDQSEQLVSLSLGASTSCHRKREKKEKEDVKSDGGGLELGLTCGFDDDQKKKKKAEEEGEKDNTFEEMLDDEEVETEEEEEKKEGWASRKILKNVRKREEDDDLQYNPIKKARVSVRARCNGVMMNDGCQWRKYGQKISKGNPCPRSYYRCTVAPGCPVRKQVQRCAEDMSILTTTYEGKHNHPLSPAASAMAATTSAAMNTLLSGSSTSRPGIDSLTSTAAVSASLGGLNFSLSDNLRARQYLSISPSHHPTVTIDLTSPESSTSQTMQMSRFSTNYTSPGLRYHPTNFNYPSLETTAASTPSWNSNYLGYYGTQLHNGNKSQFAPLNVGGQTQESFNRSSAQKLSGNPPTTQHPLTDTITAATKAITSDPSFQSALAATVASVLGGKGNQNLGESINHVMNRGDHLSMLPFSSGWKGNLPSHQPSLAFSNHKNSSSPPVDKE